MRSTTARSRVSGASTSPSPSNCTRPSRCPARPATSSRASSFATVERDRGARRAPPSTARCRAPARRRRRGARRARRGRPSAAAPAPARWRRRRRASEHHRAARGAAAGSRGGGWSHSPLLAHARDGAQAPAPDPRRGGGGERRQQGQPGEAGIGEDRSRRSWFGGDSGAAAASSGSSSSASALQASGWKGSSWRTILRTCSGVRSRRSMAAKICAQRSRDRWRGRSGRRCAAAMRCSSSLVDAHVPRHAADLDLAGERVAHRHGDDHRAVRGADADGVDLDAEARRRWRPRSRGRSARRCCRRR